MFTVKIFRHILIPSAAVIMEKTKSVSHDFCCRPSELPIYSYDPPSIHTSDIHEEPSALEQQFQETFGIVRRKISYAMGTIKEIESMGEDYISDGIATVMCYIECLQEDDSTTPKYGAIAIGGLTGLILGLRGRYFKRTLYTSIGALSMAALCYPKEAKEYSQIAYEEGMRYFTIGYNFIYGVKKGDPSVQLPTLSTLSNSMSATWNYIQKMATIKSSTIVTDTPEVIQEVDKVHPIADAEKK